MSREYSEDDQHCLHSVLPSDAMREGTISTRKMHKIALLYEGSTVSNWDAYKKLHN